MRRNGRRFRDKRALSASVVCIGPADCAKPLRD